MDKVIPIVLIILLALICVHFGSDIWHWILTVTGDQQAGTRWNLAWSGFLSAGVISGSIFTHTWHRMREANCHNKGCWRIGKTVTKDGHKLCRVCVKLPLTKLNLPVVHQDHRI